MTIRSSYSKIPLLIPPKTKTHYWFHLKIRPLLYWKSYLPSLIYFFIHFLWVKATFGSVQKWSWIPLLISVRGGPKIGNCCTLLSKKYSGSLFVWCCLFVCLFYWKSIDTNFIRKHGFSVKDQNSTVNIFCSLLEDGDHSDHFKKMGLRTINQEISLTDHVLEVRIVELSRLFLL